MLKVYLEGIMKKFSIALFVVTVLAAASITVAGGGAQAGNPCNPKQQKCG